MILCNFVILCNSAFCVALDAYQEEDYAKRLKALMHLAELCVELLKQNDEHYADVCAFLNLYLYMYAVEYVTCRYFTYLVPLC